MTTELARPRPRSAPRLAMQKQSLFGVLAVLLAVIIGFLVLYPLARTLYGAFVGPDGLSLSAFREVLTADWLPRVLINTAITVGLGGALAILAACIFAWLNERTDARMGIVGDTLALVPLLIPPIAMSVGWVFLGTPTTGFINGFLANTVGRLGLDISINFMSWPGLIFVYALHLLPYAYLVIASALRNLDPSLEEASRVAGGSTWRTLRRVTIPSVGPAVLSACLLVVIAGLSLFSVPAVIGTRANVDILSVRIIRMITFDYPPKTDSAVVLSLFLFVVIFGFWTLQSRSISRGRFATVGGRGARSSLVRLGKWKWAGRGALGLYIACTTILPFGALLVVALQPYWQGSIDPSVFTLKNFEHVLVTRNVTKMAFRNSVLLGASGAVIGMLVASILAIHHARSTGSQGRFVDAVAKLPASFSHIVIAVGILIALSGAPFKLGGTLTILLLAYVIIRLPEASTTSNSAVAQIGRDLSEASAVSGASPGRTFRLVVLPLILPALATGWALVFVLMASDVEASALLASARSPVIGFVMLDIWESGTFGDLAALAATFTCLTTTVVVLALVLSRRSNRSRRGIRAL